MSLEIAGEDTNARGLGSLKQWLVRKLGSHAGRVRLLGRLKSQDLDEAYRRAWVVLVPSRWDTFPSVVQEAMVRSKAIVASSNGGMPEMLEGTGGTVVDPETPAFAEAVVAMLDDSARRRQAGATACIRTREVFGPATIAAAYVRQVQAWL